MRGSAVLLFDSSLARCLPPQAAARVWKGCRKGVKGAHVITCAAQPATMPQLKKKKLAEDACLRVRRHRRRPPLAWPPRHACPLAHDAPSLGICCCCLFPCCEDRMHLRRVGLGSTLSSSFHTHLSKIFARHLYSHSKQLLQATSNCILRPHVNKCSVTRSRVGLGWVNSC